MKYSRIALIGMPGCGKTSVSKILSAKTNIKLYDIDSLFEEKYSAISDYFNNYGEKAFRVKEFEILKNIVKNNEFILSTGGGIILTPECRNILFEQDILTFYLKTSSEIIYNRTKKNSARPLLKNNSVGVINKLLVDRENYYLKANYVIETDNKTAGNVAEAILGII